MPPDQPADTRWLALVADLETRFGRPPSVGFATSPLGGVIAHLMAADGATAQIALQGGHVLGYRHPRHGDVLWLSPLARLDSGRPVRGGVPVCWPWFGAHATDGSKPSHGVARTAVWHVAETSGGPAPRLTLRLDDAAARASGLPLSAHLDVVLGAALEVSLRTLNVGAEPVRLGGALHSYFQVSDIASVTIGGLEGRTYVDQLAGGRVVSETEPIRFSGELDRIYQDTRDRVTILDPGSGRRIVVDKAGSASTVVWNPWIAKGERLGDLGPDGYRHMVCVETANAGADIVCLQPGATHTLTARIRAEDLAVG